MEVDFDKEIDALLRNAPNAGGSEAGLRSGTAHLFPDEIAAFAENALPDKARTLYIQHFAECERCRKILSNVISIQADEEPADVPAAAPIPSADEHEPWYRGLFRLPQLAAALGALVLVFSGLLAFMLIQRADNQESSELSKVAEQEATGAVPVASERQELTFNSANMAANATRTSANTAGNTVLTLNSNAATAAPTLPQKNEGGPDLLRSEPAARPAQDIAGEIETAEKSAAAEVKGRRDEARVAMAAPGAGAAPATAAAQANENSRPTIAGESDADKNISLAKRSAKPAVPEKRSGGKTFRQQNGVWFDTAYTGQQTLNYKRGTESYLRLDNTLRKTADAIGGTVVIIWNNRAYRIE